MRLFIVNTVDQSQIRAASSIIGNANNAYYFCFMNRKPAL